MGNDDIIVSVGENGKLPVKAHESDSGFDISASEDCNIPAGKFKLVGTDVRVKLPYGLEIQVRSRSGLAAKNGVFVLNSPGTVDNGYTGEIKIVLANFGDKDFQVHKGDRVAQLVLSTTLPRLRLVVDEVKGETDRGSNGFGSTLLA